MRDYGKVHTAFWRSETASALSDEGKLLALYLLTSDHGNLIGCYRLPTAYVADDLNWSAEKVERVFAETVAKGFANRCETLKWVYLPQYLKFNPLENPNQHKAADKLWAQVPVNVRFADLLPVKLKPFANPSETLSKPVVEAVTEAVGGTVLPEGAKSSGRRGKTRKSPLPLDFMVSDAVRSWAQTKGFDRLEEHCEAFCRKARANDYEYADWDAALMEAIRGDWAKLRGGGRNGAPPPAATGSDTPEWERKAMANAGIIHARN